MPDCVTCPLFQLESGGENCLHVNRPGGLELTQQALDILDLPSGASILDVACGTGASMQYLAGQKHLHATGLDLSFDMLKYGQSRFTDLNLLQASSSRIPLLDASQQVILMECALSLSGDTAGALAEFLRILQPGGHLIVTDVYLRESLAPPAEDCLSATSCLGETKTEADIRQMVAEKSFKIIHWQDQTALLKQWLARMIFKLGSLDAFYRQLAASEEDAKRLSANLGRGIKLGYYLMIAQKAI